MTGPKLNEAPVRRPGAARVAPGEIRGTRAVAKYARISPYKVRVVLDLIRGEDVARAQEILRFSERDAATTVGKVLGSAIANAEANDSILAEDLYVSACFADEGPTLKRWRPRARGRATRIRKRTCHITVIVSRLPAEELERKRREGASADRARRRAGQQAAEAQRGRRRARTEEPATEEPTAPEAEESGTPSGGLSPSSAAAVGSASGASEGATRLTPVSGDPDSSAADAPAPAEAPPEVEEPQAEAPPAESDPGADQESHEN